MSKYKIGDKVLVRSDLVGDKQYGNHVYIECCMGGALNKEFTIKEYDCGGYRFNNIDYTWTDEMIVGLVKEKPKQTIPTESYKVEALPFLINFVVSDNKNNIGYNSEQCKGATYKIIINDRTTIVILDDGCKGVSKCIEGDVYDKDKGIQIAYKKALIKSYAKELKELTK